ncbi:hypothetical protein EV182_002165 [Spiromyces aspiralis]|uniref:Uncharacterized protein n=1 Tax=Spiromyces aspiralis TaxID=68401 RepID=A0ACC1HUQ2_9FUNG|nr:hypothetical protein EV182_002165 [Spiromyces aspiralis]
MSTKNTQRTPPTDTRNNQLDIEKHSSCFRIFLELCSKRCKKCEQLNYHMLSCKKEGCFYKCLNDNKSIMTRYKLHHIARHAKHLDKRWGCPGFRCGIESLLSWIPVIGSFMGTILSVRYLMFIRAHFKDELPVWIWSQFLANIIIDWLVGLIPFAGFFADALYKANWKNYLLVFEHLQKQEISLNDFNPDDFSVKRRRGFFSRDVCTSHDLKIPPYVNNKSTSYSPRRKITAEHNPAYGPSNS